MKRFSVALLIVGVVLLAFDFYERTNLWRFGTLCLVVGIFLLLLRAAVRGGRSTP